MSIPVSYTHLYTMIKDGSGTLDKSVVDTALKIDPSDYSLQAYKTDAINKVTTDIGSEKYAKENWTYDRYDKVVAIQEKATDDILLATSTDAIDDIVKKAKADMDANLTKAEISTVESKVDNRLSTLGYKGATGVLEKYYDAVVGSANYSAKIKADAVAAAEKVFKDAVVATENADITYAEIDTIIKENREKALAALTSVKTTTELKAEATAPVSYTHLVTFSISSHGSFATSAVIKSSVVTARSTTA